ncbi:tetratricopeptide repeat protein [Actinomadura barringtoniae]|uniref:Tetratricopeptide repeat protein n=1 Tax=Actinomadura barringtoniae TaxID=1427535 RepID=A0A939PRQ3_9ACTN|nr:tetratricopeptide repeat protein [Actinomadura barringtoniae]MBO2455028.1 tetratricopeptide repeat protein [Actinomadura barringtoniae]
MTRQAKQPPNAGSPASKVERPEAGLGNAMVGGGGSADDGVMAGETHNELSGIVIGPAVMGRDITVTLPARVPLALSGLPAASVAFTGRKVDLAKVMEVLKPRADGPAVVVTTVAGMGGVGKTELAVQAARTALERGWFPGGVLFADLFGYDDGRMRDPTQVLEGMLRALGVPAGHIPPDGEGRVRMYGSILAEFARRGQRVLVVADNVSPDQQVSMLLPTDGECAAIVTSRHKLSMLDARRLDLGVLSRADAEDMLRRVVDLLHPGDTRVTGLDDLVEMCGRLPLAIRIVGALLADDPLLRPVRLAGELAELKPLEGLAYGGLAVAKAFARSYRVLTEEQQRTFRMLTINPGPDISTRSAAVLTGLAEPAVRQVLKDLARAHLIETGAVYGRWQMHDLIRQYAIGLEDEHADDDGRDEALSRLLDSYVERTRAATAHLGSTIADPDSAEFVSTDEVLDWLTDELPNLSAASHETMDQGLDAMAGMPVELAALLWQRRLLNGRLVLAARALEQARRTGDRTAEGDVLSRIAMTMLNMGRFEDAIKVAERAVPIFQEIGDRRAEGRMLTKVGVIWVRSRRHEEALDAYTRAEAAFREGGHLREVSRVSASLGIALADLDRYEEAVDAHRRELAISRELHDRSGEGAALTNLGTALYQGGRAEEAIVVLELSAAIFREVGDRHAEAAAGANLGRALRLVDRSEEAIVIFDAALTAFRELGDSYNAGWTLAVLGNALADTGRTEEAGPAFRAALELFVQLGDEGGIQLAERRLAVIEG